MQKNWNSHSLLVGKLNGIVAVEKFGYPVSHLFQEKDLNIGEDLLKNWTKTAELFFK